MNFSKKYENRSVALRKDTNVLYQWDLNKIKKFQNEIAQPSYDQKKITLLRAVVVKVEENFPANKKFNTNGNFISLKSMIIL